MDEARAEINGPQPIRGVFFGLFEALWTPKNDKQERASHYSDSMPRIPDTVLYNFCRPQHWYFTPKHGGKIAKRKRANLTSDAIIREMVSSSNVSSSSAIVAQVMTRDELDENCLSVEYYNATMLAALLQRAALMDTAILQAFVDPKSVPGRHRNSTTLCIWQPNYCHFERKENANSLDDGTLTLKERGETTEGFAHSGNIPIQSPSLLAKIKRTCNAIAEHLYYILGIHVRSMVVNCKVDQQNVMWLLWCQRLAFERTESLVRSPRDSSQPPLLFSPMQGSPKHDAANFLESSTNSMFSPRDALKEARKNRDSKKNPSPRRGHGQHHNHHHATMIKSEFGIPNELHNLELAADKKLEHFFMHGIDGLRRTALTPTAMMSPRNGSPMIMSPHHRRLVSSPPPILHRKKSLFSASLSASHTNPRDSKVLLSNGYTSVGRVSISHVLRRKSAIKTAYVPPEDTIVHDTSWGATSRAARRALLKNVTLPHELLAAEENVARQQKQQQSILGGGMMTMATSSEGRHHHHHQPQQHQKQIATIMTPSSHSQQHGTATTTSGSHGTASALLSGAHAVVDQKVKTEAAQLMESFF
eukprot:PhM_4_TR13996/c0_g1_i1/m.55930